MLSNWKKKWLCFPIKQSFHLSTYTVKSIKELSTSAVLLLLPNASKPSKHIWENDFSCSPNPKPINHQTTTTQNRMYYSTQSALLHANGFQTIWRDIQRQHSGTKQSKKRGSVLFSLAGYFSGSGKPVGKNGWNLGCIVLEPNE